MTIRALLALAAVLISTAAHAQQPGTTYDVVSIHPNNSLSGSTRFSINPGIATFTNATLKMLVAFAYTTRQGLVEGLPSWAESARFDIEAKVVDPDMPALKAMSREERAAMLIPILKDRFSLKLHNETRNQPVFELTLLKGGPKFKEYVAASDNLPSSTATAKRPSLGPGSVNVLFDKGGMEMIFTGISMSSLAENLARQVDKTVIDKTGLTGKYDFDLKFTPDNARMNGADVEATDQFPNIFTALQEQLGLKLVAGKGPVVTLIIDQIKQPTEN